MNKKKIILIGGGGHCKSCIDVIELESKYEISGIIDIPEKVGTEVLGYPIIGTDSDITELTKEFSNFFVTIGHLADVSRRVKVFKSLVELNVNMPVVISPTAYVSKYASVGAGSIIMHHSIINASSKIGENCIINSKALVEHDAVIGNHCHISTCAVVNGGVEVGSCTFYGSGAVSKQYTKITENSFIAANSIIK